jgi:adenine phosphoribosyltransferase
MSGGIDLEAKIIAVPDYPKPGINFKDITPLLADPLSLQKTVVELSNFFRPLGVDAIAGIEARGFILGAAVAYQLKTGFIPLRKPGKSPRDVYKMEYQLEYGIDELHVHKDLLDASMRIGIIDDVLATGGTALAAVELIHLSGAEVIGFASLLELDFLSGRKKINDKYPDLPIHSLVNS